MRKSKIGVLALAGSDHVSGLLARRVTAGPKGFQWARTQTHLGDALRALGERAGGHGAAHAAFREALQERTRAHACRSNGPRAPGARASLMLLAERRGDVEMAKLAVQQIETAFTTLSDGGDAFSAAIYERQLPKARALAQKLAKR